MHTPPITELTTEPIRIARLGELWDFASTEVVGVEVAVIIGVG